MGAAAAIGPGINTHHDNYDMARMIYYESPRVGDFVVNARQSDEQLEHRLQCLEIELERLFYLVQDLC
jgi:hypothetical protein